ncbi:MAG: GH116 family glycosyl-hydrolase [Thermoproteota archaeon]
MNKERNAIYPRRTLFGRELRKFKGSWLDQIAFPLGGIGTGTVSLSGRGELRDWEIFNRPNKGKQLPYTFAAIFVESGPKIAKVLEVRPSPPYTGSHGFIRTAAQGLPRLKDARFRGEYPFAFIDFMDDDLPVKVSLEAFNPFIPLNERDSGLPVAILKYRVRNAGKKKCKVTICLSICNAVGYDGQSHLERRWIGFGKNLNQFLREGKIKGLKMTSEKYRDGDPRVGSMALATDWENVTFTTRWKRGGWWDDIQDFWDDFSSDGKLSNFAEADPSPDGETDICSLGLLVELEAGQEAVLPFVIAWYFPIRINEWNQEEPFWKKPIKNWYATQFKDAWDVASYTLLNIERLEKETKLFHDTLFGSSLPGVVLDAVSSQVSVMRSNTCFRADNGDFYGFEGCSTSIGCCPMNCTHVWNYEQAVAFLFPNLERTMRRVDFLVNTEPDGKMAFRTRVPTSSYIPWDFHPAADGQMGCIMKLYREWLMSGDRNFLEELWPSAKRALEYAWKRWDLDQDGVMEGEQHNTYDIEFYGPNTMVGTLYLGALLAAERMALTIGDRASAQKYRELFLKGKRRIEEELWNGEYYVQRCDDEKTRYQYGTGCLSDQLLGQWFAMVVGLGYLLPKEHVRRALKSIFRYNWRSHLLNHANCQRIYAINEEAGLLICTWPKGGRPREPLVYADEVWTGIEYQVASHMIYEDMVEEALTIVKATRDRYDGRKRNPWNEVECGDHYARAMSSWALLLAFSGYRYSAPERSIEFSPRISPRNFRCFFSTGNSWGVYMQRTSGDKKIFEIRVLYGELELDSITVEWPTGNVPRKLACSAKKGRSMLETRIDARGSSVRIRLEKTMMIKRGEVLTIVFN